MVHTILYLVILCAGIHTSPVVIDTTEDIPMIEHTIYKHREDEGRTKYLNREDEERTKYLNREDEGKPRHLDNEYEGRPRYLTAEGEEAWPDEILLPGFLALQTSDLAGYLVSNMAFKLTKALLYMLWL